MNIKLFIHRHKKIISIVGLPILSMAFSHITFADSPIWAISAPFGDVDGSIHPEPHRGLDIKIPENTPVSSILDGKVVKVFHDDGSQPLGNAVYVESDDKTLIYAHLNKVEVDVGDIVSHGQEIALSGHSGRSFGNHLHIGCKVLINGKQIFVDPMPTIMKAAIGGN
jgi:murein DD-endopeptidase MepM/ murein hydrolase activator NlpD